MDASSKHQLWGSPIGDRRGRGLEQLINDKGLIVMNNNDQLTFVGHRGSSFIDVTIANRNAYELISHWGLLNEETLSDHKYIEFDITENDTRESIGATAGFCVKRADWDIFTETIEREVAELNGELGNIRTGADIERIAAQLNEGVVRACERSMPRRKSFRNSVPWWTPELTTLRKEVNRLRRSFQ